MLPNFLVIGAGKSGTTSLYHYLQQHPDIFMSSVKEPLFLAFDDRRPAFKGPGDEKLNARVVVDAARYTGLFAAGRDRRAIGEASSAYLYYPSAAARARTLLPDAKLIVVLRCPADRAYSNYLHASRDGQEPIGEFAKALEAEPGRIASGWSHFFHYKSKGFYHRQLQAWLSYFPKEQFFFALYDDLIDNPSILMRHIFQFLEVRPDFEPDFSIRYNVSGRPRSLFMRKVLTVDFPLRSVVRFLPAQSRQRIRSRLMALNLSKPGMLPHDRQALMAEYQSDIACLQDLVKRDLSKWLQAGPRCSPRGNREAMPA